MPSTDTMETGRNDNGHNNRNKNGQRGREMARVAASGTHESTGSDDMDDQFEEY